MATIKKINVGYTDGVMPLTLADLDILEEYLVGMADILNNEGDAGEGVLELSDGVEYFFTAAIKNGQLEACIGPRGLAEKMLNLHGLTTYEHFD